MRHKIDGTAAKIIECQSCGSTFVADVDYISVEGYRLVYITDSCPFCGADALYVLDEKELINQRLKLLRNIWDYPRVVKIAGFDFALDGEWNGKFFASCHGVDADGEWIGFPLGSIFSTLCLSLPISTLLQRVLIVAACLWV